MQLPDITLTATGSEREIKLTGFGMPVVLICHGQNTSKAALEVNKVVRLEYPDATEVAVASVIDLRSFPSMFHGMVKPELEKAYHKAAGKLPPGANPVDWVILLPDWDGAATDSLGVRDSTATAAVIVADSEGNIVGTRQGDELGVAVLELLAGLGK